MDLRNAAAETPTLLAAVGLAGGARAVWASQVHGVEVVHVSQPPAAGAAPVADALVTATPSVLLVTRHADCPPVLLWDETRRVVGLVHSGRRGTYGGVAVRALQRMQEWYGCTPEEVIASIGPGVRRCCYEVILDALPPKGLGEHRVEERDGAIYVDLQGLIGDGLRAAGVRTIYGEDDGECTVCGPTAWHSYRRDRTTARFAAVAGLSS